jgi:ribonuclease HII
VARPCFKIERDFPDAAGRRRRGRLRGPLAGPVVAAAVILNREKFPRGHRRFEELPLDAREAIFGRLQKVAIIGVGICSVQEIEQLNIYWARMLR